MFKVGDKVKIVKKVVGGDGIAPSWISPDMDDLIDCIGIVKGVGKHDVLVTCGGTSLDWWYSPKSLELVKEVVLPVVGLTPKCIHAGERIKEITGAINRFVDVRMPIPQEWVEELGELIQDAAYV